MKFNRRRKSNASANSFVPEMTPDSRDAPRASRTPSKWDARKAKEMPFLLPTAVPVKMGGPREDVGTNRIATLDKSMDEASLTLFGVKRKDAIADGTCVDCWLHVKPEDRDDAYNVTGMCKNCRNTRRNGGGA